MNEKVVAPNSLQFTVYLCGFSIILSIFSKKK